MDGPWMEYPPVAKLPPTHDNKKHRNAADIHARFEGDFVLTLPVFECTKRVHVVSARLFLPA